MFGIGSTELLVILVVALIVLGPRNLPKIAQTLGRALGQFQRVSKDFQRTLNTEIAFEEENEKKAEQERLIAEQVARQNAKKEQEVHESPIAKNSSSKIIDSYEVTAEHRATASAYHQNHNTDTVQKDDSSVTQVASSSNTLVENEEKNTKKESVDA